MVLRRIRIISRGRLRSYLLFSVNLNENLIMELSFRYLAVVHSRAKYESFLHDHFHVSRTINCLAIIYLAVDCMMAVMSRIGRS